MKLYLKLIIISMVSFIFAECSEIDNQEDCERIEGCDWIESDNMPGDGYCLGDFEDDEEDDWEECSEIDNQEDCDRTEWCEWSENAGCIEGEWDEEDWEDECRFLDNEEDCLEAGCEWGDDGCYGNWDDDEEGDDEEEWPCEDIESSLECEYSENCEWVNDSCQSKDGDGGALDNELDLEYSLLKNYPNPFNPQTTINFSVDEPSQISLKVYDISGKEVSNLINGFYSAGNYSIQWNAKDMYGKQLSSGIYIYQLNTEKGILSNRMVLMR